MRPLVLFLIVGVSAAYTTAQSTPPVDSDVVFEVSIASNRSEFHIGETIPLQLAFSSGAKDRYQVNMAQYDRSGRMNYEHFDVSPAGGTVDPLPTHIGSLGGLTNYRFLTSDPWTIKLNLNEWIRFTRPGKYRLVVSSERVGVRDPSNPLGASQIVARSKEVTLKIVPANPAWQKQVFSQAVASLDVPVPTKIQLMDQYTASRRQALETLRFLGTADATRQLAKRMRGESSDGLDYVCMLGLISSPERMVARSALEQALADPNHPIDGNFLYTLRMVDTPSGTVKTNWREDQQRVVEALVAALPNKQGKALSISLNTVMNEAWNGNTLPQQTTDQLVNQLVSMFDGLPLNEQSNLLSYRWAKIRSPAMVPLLRRYAQSYRDFPEMREEGAYDSLRLSANALQRWYELDPLGARPVIITEITRPRPRFDARVLGILPDKTLPEVDSALSEHFIASDNLDGSAHLASLIARYATAAILPQITEKTDPLIGKSACVIQNPILAYILRVSPELARVRIEQAIAARGKEFTACNHSLFQIGSEIHYDPLLEEIGVHSLDDPDPEVAGTAATLLGKFASRAAETALWRRYESWSAEWAGRESELDVMFAERVDDRIYELGLGQNLMLALVTGKSWLSDNDKLKRLSQLTRVKRLRDELDRYLKIWEDVPVISFGQDSSSEGFDARVAQYELHSMEALKEKLTQFPSGTKFILSTPLTESSANEQTLSEIRTFLSSHGMSAVGEKRAN
ncbi:MAG TPA: hypothetical protein VE135_11695 [Pyrinomonadaceae bacterium]|nr:hypothetical protein [Pyrinomonadaceae bacterium]